jgi:hypothetical protein
VTPALPTGGLVSMGNLDAQHYSSPGFECRMLYGIPGAVGKLNVVFLNYAKFVVVAFAAPAAFNHRGQLDELASAFQQHFSVAGSSS